MRTYKKESIETERLQSITCDVCKKIFDAKRGWLEIQEFHSIHFEGGYDSVFGDSNTVQCDICQHCLKNLLGSYLRIGTDEEESRSERYGN